MSFLALGVQAKTFHAVKLSSSSLQKLKDNTMGLIKEPKNVNFSARSEAWSEEELADFRQLMQKLKAKNAAGAKRRTQAKRKQQTL
ncbi:hypothetical protein [Hymenobacter sp.]|jgi:hypothetical protein|uniref:hypothetical protein n=1 Tax=Hymenobacter sp. TaxID=1898978 RepID=UPI002ED95C41